MKHIAGAFISYMDKDDKEFGARDLYLPHVKKEYESVGIDIWRGFVEVCEKAALYWQWRDFRWN